jgi:Na+/H+-dicarboxylate symporter
VDIPGFSDWLSGLIPANAFKAAADGSILQLIVFTVLFAIALGRVEEAKRNALLNFFTAIKEAMYVLIGWIMAAAPFGVFALMLPLATKMGTSAAGAFGYFILIACSLITLAMILLYPLAVWVGRVRLVDFARASAPAQVIGFSTRSSLASLPAMISAAENLRLSPRISGLLLPIAVSVFKFASPIGRSCGAYFIAKLYGIELGPTDILIIAGALGVMSFYSPGIPSGGLLVMTPLFVSLNLPVEGIGILIALDLVVDMFITPTNVAANLTVATLLTRGDRGG